MTDQNIMTRRQYASQYLDEFCEKNGVNRNEVTDWGIYMRASSSLAVCLEFLGLLTPNQEKYSKSRAGIIKISKCANGCSNIYTMRDLLNELPDEGNIPEVIDIKSSSVEEILGHLRNRVNKYTVFIDGSSNITKIIVDHNTRTVTFA